MGWEAATNVRVIPELPPGDLADFAYGSVAVVELRSLTLDDELDATITLTTAHKAKGLEWDFVCLYDDFNADPLAPDTDPGKRDDELNLIYVAVTRAMKILAINSHRVDPTQDRIASGSAVGRPRSIEAPFRNPAGNPLPRQGQCFLRTLNLQEKHHVQAIHQLRNRLCPRQCCA